MKNHSLQYIKSFIAYIFILNFTSFAVAQSQDSTPFIKGQIILKVNSLNETNLLDVARFARIKKARKITSMMHPTAIISLDSEVQTTHVKDFISKINAFSSSLNSNASSSRLARVKTNKVSPTKDNIILLFHDNVKVEQIMGSFAALPYVYDISLNHELKGQALPNDRYVDSDRNGILDISPRTQIPWAWHYKTVGADQPRSETGRGVLVAVIDAGLIEPVSTNSKSILQNPELKDQLWNNPGEIPADGIDNDKNGFIDDVYGANFVADEECDATGKSCSAIERSIPWASGIDYHGVAVASLIAAKSNNGIGMAGIADGAKIMGIKAMTHNSGTSSAIAKSVIYATKKGADIINLSLGGDYGSLPSSKRQIVEDALYTAYLNGVIVIASAGNSSANAQTYLPAGYDKVISVGATDINNKLSSFSNFGSSVDIAAPGTHVGVFNTTHLFGYTSNPYNDINIHRSDLYSQLSGTSFSAPIVAGVVALMLERNPTLSMEEISSILKQSATPIVGEKKEIQGGIVNIPGALSLVRKYNNSIVRQNPVNIFDTNADGVVSPVDALIIVNALNKIGGNSNYYLDVSGDGELSPLDALLVINRLKRNN